MGRPSRLTILATLAAIAACAGCQSGKYRYTEPAYSHKLEAGTVIGDFQLDPVLEERILALDPDHVSGSDVKDVLSHAPAPRIINVHGGIYPVYQAMESFGKFLIAMGYPEGRVRNPRDGTYSFSCYDPSEKIAGAAAWYYEHEGMRPMMIGHSQGGMQTVKVLHELAGTFHTKLGVWNPLTNKPEYRDWILDPFTGEKRPITGIKISYASAVGSGGMTRFMPNQWSMAGKLRDIPDTAVEFTGFYKNLDLLGGDLAGFGDGNSYHATGTAKVRTIALPFDHDHYFVPYTLHLAEYPETRDWINSYVQNGKVPERDRFKVPAQNIVWAADVWTSVKRHWVLELQTMIRAKKGTPQVTEASK
jgi:hypothetical protein